MRLLHGISLCLFALLFTTCGLHTEFLQSHDIVYNYGSDDVENPTKNNPLCREPLSYAPDAIYPEHTPLAAIRINMHFMDLETGQHNFNEEDGRQFAMAVINGCNERLANNVQMHLPLNNNIPVLPTRYQLQLTGSGPAGVCSG